jgi:hypothetical protein
MVSLVEGATEFVLGLNFMSMDKKLTELLDKLLIVLKEKGFAIVEWFDAGIERGIIRSQVELSFPNEVFELYEWRNGIKEDLLQNKTIGDLTFFGLGYFPNFGRSLITYNNYKNHYWEKAFFPLFESGGGEYYLINCDKLSNDYKTIFFWSPSDEMFEDVISIFDSLNNLIESIIHCYDSGAYYLDENKSLRIDGNKEIEVCTKLNPQSEYWKLFQINPIDGKNDKIN